MTSRDFQVIEFVKEIRVASTSTIRQLFFSSKRMAEKRLRVIYNSGYLKRMRDSITNEYIYFHTKPKQLKHTLLISEFYRELSKYVSVKTFKVEYPIGDIRPDALFGFEYQGKKYIGLLEVEISHKGLDLHKYNYLYANERYKQYFPTMPIIFIVSDIKSLPQTPYRCVLVNTLLSEIPVRLDIR